MSKESFMSDQLTEVLSHPGMITALTSRSDRGTVLSVYRSVIARPDGASYGPVRILLGQLCSTELLSEEREDPRMVFGMAVITTHMLWETCPGTPDHRCVRRASLALIEGSAESPFPEGTAA